MHYGAHDFDPRISPFEEATGVEQHEANLGKVVPFQSDTFALLTIVVTQKDVTFYRNIENLGNSTLPRPSLTDCFNGGEGMLVGDAGLELGVCQYGSVFCVRMCVWK